MLPSAKAAALIALFALPVHALDFKATLEGQGRAFYERCVQLLADLGAGSWDVSVTGTEVVHHVRLRPDGDRCTCP